MRDVYGLRRTWDVCEDAGDGDGGVRPCLHLFILRELVRPEVVRLALLVVPVADDLALEVDSIKTNRLPPAPS